MSVDNKFLVRDKITLKVTGLGSSGEGVGKTDGFTVFAHGALADETVEVELELSLIHISEPTRPY